MSTDQNQKTTYQAWPHRVAMLLVCLTAILIWIGSVVTTTKSGMAVPDWPTTYGYNMFLYDWQIWYRGPNDIFLEHGHRLFGSLIGFMTIVLVAVMYYQL